MSELAPPPIGQLLKAGQSALARIFAKVQQLKQVNEVFVLCLDPKLRKHCVVANTYSDKMVVLVENAAIATQLRFSIPDILPLLRKKHPLLKEIRRIECKVNEGHWVCPFNKPA